MKDWNPRFASMSSDQGAARSQGNPGKIQFETDVAFTVQTVVYEEINLTKLREQPGKTKPAGTLDVRPAARVTPPDRHTDLPAPMSFYGRQVYAP